MPVQLIASASSGAPQIGTTAALPDRKGRARGVKKVDQNRTPTFNFLKVHADYMSSPQKFADFEAKHFPLSAELQKKASDEA
jgi:hypothetical protein